MPTRIELGTRTQAIPQTPMIRNIISDRWVYDNYPEWQRSNVWFLARKRNLIRSLLAGRYVPPIVAYRSFDISDPRIYILDGRQRQTTILEYIDGKFGLTGPKSGYYRDLSEEAKQCFLNYTLSYAVLQETDQEVLRATYRDLQNLTPLTTSVLYWQF